MPSRLHSLQAVVMFSLGCGPVGVPSDAGDDIGACTEPDDGERYFVYSAGISAVAVPHEGGVGVLVGETVPAGGSFYEESLSGAYDLGGRAEEAEEDMILRSATQVTLDPTAFSLPYDIHLFDGPPFPEGSGPCRGGDWVDFDSEHPGADGVWSLSQVGFSCDGSMAAFYFETNCGLLWIDGYYVFVSRLGDLWVYQDHWRIARS